MVFRDVDRRLSPGGGQQPFGNALYENLGGGKFAEVSDQLHLETHWPWE